VLGRIKRRYCDDGTIGQTSSLLALLKPRGRRMDANRVPEQMYL
jgi:hypothetical protein